MRYQLRAQGCYFVPRTQHGRWGHRGGSPGERPHDGIAGKVLPSGTFPAKRDPVWTQGLTYYLYRPYAYDVTEGRPPWCWGSNEARHVHHRQALHSEGKTPACLTAELARVRTLTERVSANALCQQNMCAERDKSWPPAWRRCYGDVTSMHKVYLAGKVFCCCCCLFFLCCCCFCLSAYLAWNLDFFLSAQSDEWEGPLIFFFANQVLMPPPPPPPRGGGKKDPGSAPNRNLIFRVMIQSVAL